MENTERGVAAPFADPSPQDIEAAHRIYDESRRVLVGCYQSSFLDQARDEREERFWVCVADFFLRERQRELVAEGVF